MKNFLNSMGNAMMAALLGLFPCTFFAYQPKRPESFVNAGGSRPLARN